MKEIMKKTRPISNDSLFGLLSLYKSFNTYIRVLISEEEKKISVQITENPANWTKVPKDKYKKYRVMRRLEIGSDKLSIKFMKPDYIVKFYGPLLNIKLPPENVVIDNHLGDEGFFIIDTPSKYRKKIFQGIDKIINLSPQKKYEIIEKCIVDNQED
jgi:hypothetical protein